MRYWAVILLLLTLVVAPVCASYNFQNSGIGDFYCKLESGSGACGWIESTDGGNSYSVVSAANLGILTFERNANPNPMTYSAATLLSSYWGTCSNQQAKVRLYDSAGASLYDLSLGCGDGIIGRYEVNVVGGVAKVYRNGILKGTSGALAQNPSYIGWGAYQTGVSATTGMYWDDIVYGSTDDKTTLGFPKTNAFYLKKDYVNPGANGFYNGTTGALISSTAFTSTFSRSNLSGEALVSQPVQLINMATGTVYETEYTGTASTGTITWHTTNLTTAASYGWYQSKLGTTLSDPVSYIANGATISFDQDEYAAGDTATTTYLIDAAYWDSSTYDYYIRIIDIYGTKVSETAIASASGSTTYTWQEDDTQGVYYAEIIGKPKAGGDEVFYNYDYATLSATFTVYGYVHDAETTLPISGALVNASQGGIISNATSGADGNYSVSGFITGTLFGMNTTATGYRGYWNNFTPFYNHRIGLNVTLLSTSPITTGITLGGVARDTAYGRPLSSVSVDIWNVTDSQRWTATTNDVGFYNKTSISENRQYSIEGMRIGYANSSIYNKMAVQV